MRKKRKDLSVNPLLESAIPHFTSKYPDEPQSSCHDTHYDVEQEVMYSVPVFCSHYNSFRFVLIIRLVNPAKTDCFDGEASV
jgi:hypothetical protein